MYIFRLLGNHTFLFVSEDLKYKHTYEKIQARTHIISFGRTCALPRLSYLFAMACNKQVLERHSHHLIGDYLREPAGCVMELASNPRISAPALGLPPPPLPSRPGARRAVCHTFLLAAQHLCGLSPFLRGHERSLTARRARPGFPSARPPSARSPGRPAGRTARPGTARPGTTNIPGA